MIRLFIGVALLGLFSVPAQARITIFSKQNVAVHVLNSRGLAQLEAGELRDLTFSGISVTKSGPEGIGASFGLVLEYTSRLELPVVPTVCKVKAVVVAEKAPSTHGITASQLSEPKFGKPDCTRP